ncbi:kelch repeat-containing protein [uncultured Erythrobacter sp.]|uniref:Kelch repeat-containing protein n=1 Tax=uncultured Erythrobacter sp. TaxID=263913 RepID=UPI002605E594|nr:kelch repeat-containing protein [uncultured Erythrobacter sp.]
MLKFAFRAFVAILLAIALAWWAGPSLLRSDGDMVDPRSEIHAAELDGIIYVAGGIGFFRTLDSCAAFDVSTEEFLVCPNLPRSLHHVAMASGEGRVFASGGYKGLPFRIDDQSALFSLDPDSLDPTWQEISPLPRPRGQHAMVYHSGAVWLIGGEEDGKATGSLMRFDLARKDWQAMAPMPTPRHSHAIAMDGARLFVTGGRSAALGGQSRVIEVYDFDSNNWSSMPDAPFDLGGHGAAAFNGRLHVFGGEDFRTGTVLRQHASIDPSDLDAGWREDEALPFPRHGFATARVGNTVWIIGGAKRAGLRTPWSVTGTAFPVSQR